MGGLVCIDAHLDNLNQLGIAPFLSKDYFYKILDMNHKRTIDAFSIQPDGKGVKKKFSFASEFADGMAALDFTNPESGLSDRIEKNVKFFNVFGSVRHFYSDGHISSNHTYQNGNWGFVDSTGKLAILPKFSRVQLFNKGVAIVEAGRKWALIDKKGALASPRYYNDIERMKNDTLFLVKDFFGGLGFFDKRFDTKLPARVRGKVEAPGYNIYPVQCKNKKWAYRHFNGTWLTDSIYAHAKPFTDGHAAFCKDELWGYIDTNGVVVIKPIYAEAKSMHCKRAFVKLPNKEEYMLINDKGLRVGKMSFKEVMAFEQDLAIVYKDGFWGVIDQTGEWVYANEFSSIDPFNLHGEAKSVKAGKTYIISSEKSIKPFDKKEMTYFKVPKQLSEKEIDEYNKLIMRKMKGVSLNIDKKLYHKNSIAETEYLPFLQPNKYGLISRTGKIYLPVEYQFVEQYTSDIFKVYFDNEIGYFSVKKGWLYKPWL
jgi:YHS domain-containing protein